MNYYKYNRSKIKSIFLAGFAIMSDGFAACPDGDPGQCAASYPPGQYEPVLLIHHRKRRSKYSGNKCRDGALSLTGYGGFTIASEM